MKDLSEILDVFRKHFSFLITSHENPEGDNIGSQLALASLLRELGKESHIRNADPVPTNLLFLPGSKDISNDLTPVPSFEVAVVLDCGELGRVGKVEPLVKKASLIVNIDHHLSNPGFGHINYVDAKAAAVGEMLFDFFSPLGIKIGKERATCLYTAIVADTGSFQYENTSPHTHAVAAMLLQEGIDPSWISEKVFQSRPVSAYRLLALVLSNLTLSEDGRIAGAFLTRDMYQKAGAREDDTEGFVEHLRSIQGVEAAILFFEEEDGTVRVSFRSRGEADVSAAAREFGGGGHRNAAGCTITGKLDEVREKVIQEIRRRLPSPGGSPPKTSGPA